MKRNNLAYWIILSIVLGCLSGWIAKAKELVWITDTAIFISTIFLRLLRMIIIPLIISSIISGVVGIGNPKRLGKLGIKTFSYYILTSFIAIVTGLFFVNMIQPGINTTLLLNQTPSPINTEKGTLIDIFIRMIPTNFFESVAQGKMLPVIFFSIIFGFFMLQSKKTQQLQKCIEGIFDTMMKITQKIIFLAPFGVWGLMTKLVATTGFSAFKPLSWYALTVLLSLLFHGSITLPILVWITSRKSPWLLFKHMRSALLTSFSTSSSSATLPLTMESLEKNAKVSNETSSFVLPLGATINMDGTALYECVAVVFIAQAYGVDLNLSNQIIIVITAMLASIGAAGIPMAGLVMMSVVLNAVGLPLEGVGLIIAVDRVLDMCRTTINVWSDSCGAFLIDNLDKKYANKNPII
jgi:proton glutamate symport protein